MAFDINAFDNVTSGSSLGPRIWSYGSSVDSLATIAASGYFDDVKFRIEDKDLVYVSGTDGAQFVKLSSSAGEEPVTTTVWLPSDGGGEINLGTANQIAYYASTGTTISSVVSTPRASFTTASTGEPTWVPVTDGQIVIGSTAGSPAAASLTAGTGIGVTSASNAITIATSSAVPLAVTVPFTAAQWNAMYATPVQLVAAPGPGLCHIVISCAIFFNYGGTNQFANGGAVVLQWGTAANGAGNSPVNTMAATNFTGLADSLTMQTVIAKSNAAKVNFDNLSLCLSNQTAAFTGGTNNTLNVVVSYYTVASGW